MTRAARGAASRLSGRRAETIAAWLLRLKGYRILARDRREVGGEIDLVARRGRMLVFVEVKRRGSPLLAAEAVRVRQRVRIERAAANFLARRPALAGCAVRFDAVLLGGGLPRHVTDAWRDSGR